MIKQSNGMFDKEVAKATTTVDDIDSPLVQIIMERSTEDLMADYLDDDVASIVDRDPATLVLAKDFDKDFLARMRNTKAGTRNVSTVVASGSTLDFEDQSLFDEMKVLAETPDKPRKRVREGAIKTVHEVFDPEWIKAFEETPYNPGGDQ